ncbi:MAG: hypothetical protein CME62_07435 [Halobacteriovoraceae bacterium]|nr:hypothetical protein [Halobacteriovoraceae bacterium]|tara:strand:+ start:25155 stop:25625 length:471 start_codon:yes stop_codon:yes gene_type:complete
MKTLIMTLITFTTLSAQASFFQTTCTNSKGTIVMNSGHMNNELSITKQSCGDNQNGCKQTKIILDRREHNIEILEDLIIETNENRGCRLGDRAGFWSSKTTSAKKIVIRKNDGSKFELDSSAGSRSYILDLSQDKLEINGFLICERFISNRIMCED